MVSDARSYGRSLLRVRRPGPARQVRTAEPRPAMHCDLLGTQRAGGPPLSALALFTVVTLASQAPGAREPAQLVKSGYQDNTLLRTVPSSACDVRAALQARCDTPLLSMLPSWTPGTTEPALLIKSGLSGHASTCTPLYQPRALAPPDARSSGHLKWRLATRRASPTPPVRVAASGRVLPCLRLTVSKDF